MDSVALPFDINILTNPRKKSFTRNVMEEQKVSVNVYVNSEWPHPPQENWHPQAFALEPKQEIAYRIFRGHQEALQVGTKEFILMLEDDAIPQGDWKLHTQQALELLQTYDTVQLYAKATNWVDRRFNHYGREYLTPSRHPSFGTKWTNGAVAYIVKRETAKKIYQEKYVGVPYDVHLVEYFNSCCIAQNQCIFEHSMQHGSTFWNPQV